MTAKAEKILLVSMEERWKKYRVQLKTCRREFSEEAVHDLRIAARRLLAVLDIVRALDPHPRVQKARRALKDQLDSFDDLRDIQVMLVDVVETIEALPQLVPRPHKTVGGKWPFFATFPLQLKEVAALGPFVELLRRREKVFLRSARRQTRTSHPSELSRRIEKIHAMLEKYSHDEDFNTRLLGVVDQAFLSAAQAYGQIDAARPATIHGLRIAFKKFRYMVEIVHPILPGFPEVHFRRMHDYQSMMGVIQDVDVLLGTLADYAESNGSSFDLEPARRYYEQRRADLIAAYLDDKGELNIFWRSAPEKPFPWEKNHDPVHRPSRNRRAGGNSRRRQPAPADRQGAQEISQDRKGLEGTGNPDRPDPDQPISASESDS